MTYPTSELQFIEDPDEKGVIFEDDILLYGGDLFSDSEDEKPLPPYPSDVQDVHVSSTPTTILIPEENENKQEEIQQKEKGKRGRPKGSKNKECEHCKMSKKNCLCKKPSTSTEEEKEKVKKEKHLYKCENCGRLAISSSMDPKGNMRRRCECRKKRRPDGTMTEGMHIKWKKIKSNVGEACLGDVY